MPCRMPVGDSALLPHRVYQDAEGRETGAKAYIHAGAHNADADYSAMKPVKTDGKFGWLADDKGEWTVRNDVVLCESYLDENKFNGGRSTPLSATANGQHIGPELGFGHVTGTFHDEPVLLIKADIGNRSLGWDCLPPGSKAYEFEGQMIPGYGGTPDNPEATGGKPKEGWYAGLQYDDYTKAIRGVLDNFDTRYPQFKDQGYEVAGFVWWQGHKDGGSQAHITHYEQNMANLIKVWRKEFSAPEAKWVIATVAFGGWELSENYQRIAAAQLAVSGDSGKHPEFEGNVKTIEARGFWRTQAESPTGTGYHYNHNAETYYLVGDALGRAMVELPGGKAAPGPVPPRPATKPKQWPAKPSLAEAAGMIYTDEFLAPWTQGEAEPTPEQMKAMAAALRPMIVGSLVPAYVAGAPRVPAYRRHGVSLIPIVTGKAPNAEQMRGSAGLTSQLDLLISYYNAAGIHDYDWKPFGPDMRTGSWQYHSFDPPEKQEPAKGGRNRPITSPKGMENWFAPDFDAAAAGWKTGAAPFGQKDGKQEALSPNCSDPQCGCGITPGTLWEKEVLLMRQTFDIPELSDDHRYRLILGGGSHAFSGEGYAIYVNGKLFSESEGGHYKGNGGARGGYILNDFMPEFKKGKVTIAARPKVLFFGDSISGGYSTPLVKLMEGKAEMVKLGAVATYRINEEAFWHSNGKAVALDFGSAKACIADLDRFAEHLVDNRYDVIHFNFGLNDIFRSRGGAWHNPVDQYAKDLEKIVGLLKKNGAKVIWANITPIPDNCPHNPVGDELIYNAAAETVMKKHGIPINDLHGVVTGWDGYAEWQKGNDVHFPGAVYSKLAKQIAATILAQLESPARQTNRGPGSVPFGARPLIHRGPEVPGLERMSASGFLDPPDPYKSWVYWWWLKGWIDEEGIRADLDHMKSIGISGALVFNALQMGDEVLKESYTTGNASHDPSLYSSGLLGPVKLGQPAGQK